MGLVSNIALPTASSAVAFTPLGQELLNRGTLCVDDLLTAMWTAKRQNVPLETVLCADWHLSEDEICSAQATAFDALRIDPVAAPPDPRLIAAFGAQRILKTGLLPWRNAGAATVVLCTSVAGFMRHRDALAAYLGPVRLALTTPTQLAKAMRQLRDPHLTHAAETQLPERDSSRCWNSAVAQRWVFGMATFLGAALLTAPVVMAALFCLLVSALVILTTALKLAATIAGWKTASGTEHRSAALPVRLPTITLLVPLYKERDITAHLIRRLDALDYPRSLLDVCLVLEANDTTTRQAIDAVALPSWMRPIAVPEGTLKTKPRALNYAMTFAHGSIIGVYDAEDAPAPDQLRTVANHFANATHDVACLQGTLDYYNPTANWLTRCFTLEYASWFRVILPGFAKLGLVVPLGGTTLFFRRTVLEKLGGWDAHNVTEDADLGVRLARRGYRTEFMASVTEEEANGRMWPWVKQRSRWLKGYAITYAVHMRDPFALWRDLGAWRFFGVQLLFLGTLLQFALAPVVWSFWLMPLGIPHPLQAVVPPAVIWGLAGAFIAAGLINLAIYIIGARRAGKPRLAFWAPTLQLYFSLAVAAVYKGLVELTWKPFYWDKTTHGVLMPDATLPPRRPAHPASDGQQMPH
ncbi:Glycosyltransferase, catalytic subunit of cellulose synthase and poly-beta-1,6-N-acetylglucosamine synthase [Cognatiyoonia koreensis]|uniref:Glycosyltransferase, catalytic subunit of cellulose synthase and poly-beta-1,6-N-acetylglucosamine synthase n=2 Tax=Cognatiyoonia koreensis TaxID=364200 RepID=A0A1I0NHE9_9RHOB|nr:Glycosyltransferase, catalytic subunit of cellulose synthase and poly-beta-1,6-N-acetylglucosamine synthase [Cognatiyoonia koreensis]